MLWRWLSLIMLAILSSCNAGGTPFVPIAGPFEARVNPALAPAQASVPDAQGNPQPVAASRDEHGVQSDFVEGLVLVRPTADAPLQAFLDRYEGVVISDDTIPEPPPSLGIFLTPEQRQATEYVVRINLARADVENFAAHATAAGLTGILEFSSEAGLQTMAAVAAARDLQFDASPEYMSYPNQFPQTLFGTQERTTGPLPPPPQPQPPPYVDAFTTVQFQATGSQSNVTLAWQFLAAHGIQRRVQVAIIDDGYWLNPDGTPRGNDFDLPANPIQYDFINDDFFADGPNGTACGATNPCFWHGTGSAGVATGIMNNQQGAAGTGALVADPFLFKAQTRRSNANWAIRTALAWGADIVSMSWGGPCNQACRIYDREHTPFDDAVRSGSRAVFIAAAGNGRGTPAVGFDVGDPEFVHPCIESHVICVGALNDGATTKTTYSNFGDRVDIFAPTNLPAMSRPASTDNNPNGPATQGTAGGTSASTPFVAGVAAMMKAVNPDLTGAEVATILRETAYPGTSPVTRYINAYAAVRRAAEGFDIVPDRFEPNSVEASATDLGTRASYIERDLNLDGRDRDYFKFEAPGGSTMTVDLEYPLGLGTVSVFSMMGLGGGCGSPVFTSEADLSGRGRRFTYSVPGGPLQLALNADDVNAYNLGISFATATFGPDVYEPNNQVAAARHIHSIKPVGSGLLSYFGIEPRVTINATIHTATDLDYYIVRGANVTLTEQVFIAAYPALLVYGNDSPIGLHVYRLNPDNTQGSLVGSAGGGSCIVQPLSVRLDADVLYLALVSGTPGSYTLRNGVDGDQRHFPILVRDRVYEVLNPGEPIENVLRFQKHFVFVADRAFTQVRTSGQLANMRLFDFDGNQVAESEQAPGGIVHLSLAQTLSRQVYALQVTPLGTPEELDSVDLPALRLAWDEAQADRTSGNLIVNPGAEITVGDSESDIPGWTVTAGTPVITAYDLSDRPASTDPGPAERGMHLFAGGSNHTLSRMEQTISISEDFDATWLQAIDEGRLKFRFSAFLGGLLDRPDQVNITATFLDTDFEPLGGQALPVVTSLERGGQAGLLPVETSDYLPLGTRSIHVAVTFQGPQDDYIHGYADNIELVLSQFAP